MKPSLKLRNRQSTNSSFEELVRAAMKCTERLTEMGRPKSRRPTPAVFLTETIEFAQSSPERIATLRKKIEGDAPGLDNLRQAVRSCVQFLRTPNCDRPPSDDRRLNFLFTDAARAELPKLQTSQTEIFAVAVQIAGEKYPDSFGTCENSARHDEKMAELKEQQRAFFKKIGSTPSANDMSFATPDKEGRSLVTFKISEGNVPVAPSDDAGERLVKYLLNNPQAKKKVN